MGRGQGAGVLPKEQCRPPAEEWSKIAPQPDALAAPCANVAAMTTFVEVHAAGKRARRAGQSREMPAELGHGYRGGRPAREVFMGGWDEADEEVAYEQSRPCFAGEGQWSPARRRRPLPPDPADG